MKSIHVMGYLHFVPLALKVGQAEDDFIVRCGGKAETVQACAKTRNFEPPSSLQQIPKLGNT